MDGAGANLDAGRRIKARSKGTGAVTMDITAAARPADNNGVVVMTLLLASKTRAQVLSFMLKKSDQNVVRMLTGSSQTRLLLLPSSTKGRRRTNASHTVSNTSPRWKRMLRNRRTSY